MTYENFVKGVTTRDGSLTRKDVARFTKKFAVSFMCFSFVILYFCICTLPSVVVPLVGILLAFLMLFLFDYMADSEVVFKKIMKMSSFWWLNIILAVGFIVLITYTCT